MAMQPYPAMRLLPSSTGCTRRCRWACNYVPEMGNAACTTCESWIDIYWKKSDQVLETCIVLPHVQILVFYRNDGNVS